MEHLIIPNCLELLNKGIPHIRIWSAACSTGQEPYSLAILIAKICEQFKKSHWIPRFKILATDISKTDVNYAKRGSYTEFELKRGLPYIYRDRYFEKSKTNWHISQDFKSMCHFKQFNLMDDFSVLGRFHIVLCRNVAVYFSEEAKISLFLRLGEVVKSKGFLLLGSSEYFHSPGSKLTRQEFRGGIYYANESSVQPIV